MIEQLIGYYSLALEWFGARTTIALIVALVSLLVFVGENVLMVLWPEIFLAVSQSLGVSIDTVLSVPVVLSMVGVNVSIMVGAALMPQN